MKFSFTLLILGLSVCCNGYLDSNNMYSGQPEEKKNSDTAGSKEMSTLEKKKYLAAKYFSPGDKRPFMEKLASMSSEDKAIVFECAKNSSDISAAHVDGLLVIFRKMSPYL